MLRRWTTRAVVLAALVLPTNAAQAAEFYYVLVFGSQSHPRLARYTHTWATFVRAIGEGPDPDAYELHVHTISWLPREIEIEVWRAHPEPGVNLDMEQTLQAVYASGGQHVTMWGPFLVPVDVYNRSLWVKQILESGLAQYRAISSPHNLLITDCIHALAAVDPIFGREQYPLIRFGNPASRFVAREIMTRSLVLDGINQATLDNSWLIPRLGLDRYPITFIPPQQIPFRRCFFCRLPP